VVQCPPAYTELAHGILTAHASYRCHSIHLTRRRPGYLIPAAERVRSRAWGAGPGRGTRESRQGVLSSWTWDAGKAATVKDRVGEAVGAARRARLGGCPAGAITTPGVGPGGAVVADGVDARAVRACGGGGAGLGHVLEVDPLEGVPSGRDPHMHLARLRLLRHQVAAERAKRLVVRVHSEDEAVRVVLGVDSVTEPQRPGTDERQLQDKIRLDGVSTCPPAPPRPAPSHFRLRLIPANHATARSVGSPRGSSRTCVVARNDACSVIMRRSIE